MAVEQIRISEAQALQVISTPEGQFADVKAIEIAPASLTKTIAAFANADGGELFIGIEEFGEGKVRRWRGFENQEAANGHVGLFERLFPLGTDFHYEFLESPSHPGLVLHIDINKTQDIMRASNQIAYIRRGASKLPVESPEAIRRLEYSKGISSFETELTNVPITVISESEVVANFIEQVVPTSTPEAWLKKQTLIREDRPSVAGVLLFADEPQASLPKRCGIKVYRYKTKEAEGFRGALAFDPETVEGSLYDQIHSAVKTTTEHTERVPKLGEDALETIKYPPETLHEIITNAVLHRDYSVADDVHIRIFDNRIEVQSPGKLPAHVTVKNILYERFARNGALVRILNKFPNPPNKDVGEGLNTAFAAMHDLGLKEPVIRELENAVLVTIKHEPLASPEEAIMDYLATHDTIKNAQARAVTHIRADYQVKIIFGRMVDKGLIEQVPGTRTSNTAYRKVSKPAPDEDDFGQMKLI
ncbi:ATP-binding protein [Sphingopyxis terrae subsp. ummariensis]